MKIFNSFDHQIFIFSKQPNAPIAKMTKQAPNPFCFVAMIYVKSFTLMCPIWNWLIATNKTFILLLFNHFFKLVQSYSISSFDSRFSFVIGKLFLFFRIFACQSKSFMTAFFASIGSSGSHAGIFVK